MAAKKNKRQPRRARKWKRTGDFWIEVTAIVSDGGPLEASEETPCVRFRANKADVAKVTDLLYARK
jgi:hypothetical protein